MNLVDKGLTRTLALKQLALAKLVHVADASPYLLALAPIGLERDQYRVLVGRDAKLLYALHRLSPQRAAAFITKVMKDLLPRGGG